MESLKEFVKENRRSVIVLSALVIVTVLVCIAGGKPETDTIEQSAQSAVISYLHKTDSTLPVSKPEVAFSEFKTIDNYSAVADADYISMSLRVSLLERLIYNAGITSEKEREESLARVISNIRSYSEGLNADSLTPEQEKELALYSDIYYWTRMVQGKDISKGIENLDQIKMQYESQMELIRVPGYRCVGTCALGRGRNRVIVPFDVVMTTACAGVTAVEKEK